MSIVKTWMFILGIIILVVSVAAILISLGYAFAFLASLPQNLIVFLAIDAIAGLIMIIISLQRTLY
jgi:arginine exporter protein ArgO